VQIEEPFYVLHEVVEHHAIEPKDQILAYQVRINLRVKETVLPGMIMHHDTACPRRRKDDL
jgi:hypothetical protein